MHFFKEHRFKKSAGADAAITIILVKKYENNEDALIKVNVDSLMEKDKLCETVTMTGVMICLKKGRRPTLWLQEKKNLMY